MPNSNGEEVGNILALAGKQAYGAWSNQSGLAQPQCAANSKHKVHGLTSKVQLSQNARPMSDLFTRQLETPIPGKQG